SLLAHEDGSYEWVQPADYRVAEVRLLSDAGTVGEAHSSKERAKDNLLIRGDALNALTSLIELPEFAREYLGKVKLVYIDPPFNYGSRLHLLLLKELWSYGFSAEARRVNRARVSRSPCVDWDAVPGPPTEEKWEEQPPQGPAHHVVRDSRARRQHGFSDPRRR